MKTLFLFFMILCLFLDKAHSDQSSENEWTKAIRLFQIADQLALEQPSQSLVYYRDSALLFEYLAKINHPSTSAAISHYNAGVSWHMTKEFGKAIYHYSLADRLGLESLELRQNLTSAQKERIDQFDDQNLTDRINRLLPDVYYRFWFTLLLTSLLCLYSGYRWLNPIDKNDVSRLELLVYPILITTLVLTLLSYALKTNKYDAVIVSNEINARKGPSLLYEDAFTSKLHSGTEVWILSNAHKGWLHIKLPDNSKVWIAEKGVWRYDDFTF